MIQSLPYQSELNLCFTLLRNAVQSLILILSHRNCHAWSYTKTNMHQSAFTERRTARSFCCGSLLLLVLAVRIYICCLAHRGSTVGFLLLQCSSDVVRYPGDLRVSVATRFCRVLIFASSSYLSVIYLFPLMIH